MKRYQKLPRKIQEQFEGRLELFVVDRFDSILNNHLLAGQYALHRSINITGDYRAVYRDVNAQSVKWVAIGTHSQLYD